MLEKEGDIWNGCGGTKGASAPPGLPRGHTHTLQAEEWKGSKFKSDTVVHACNCNPSGGES